MIVFPPHLITDIFNNMAITDKDKSDLKLVLSQLQQITRLPKGEFVLYLLSMVGGYSYEMNYDDETVYLSALVDYTVDGVYVVGRDDFKPEFKLKVKEICDVMGVSSDYILMFISNLITMFENVLFNSMSITSGRKKVNIYKVDFINGVMLVYM